MCRLGVFCSVSPGHFRVIVGRVSTTGGGNAIVPTEGQRFVGREDDLKEISDLIDKGSDRMITLVGRGGIGKTRLATEAARAVRIRDMRLHWVRLARLPVGSDYDAVESEIAATVIAADYSTRGTWRALVETLDRAGAEVADGERVVLVLDNCEHVVDAVSELVPRLLDSVPGLTILATSRCPIGWIDEHLVPVKKLPESEAVTLFRRRAELTGCAPIPPSEDAVVAQICRHVGCAPLFIQLAAARLRYQELQTVRAELTGGADDGRMRWTSGPARSGADERHRGVTNVIAWSYELCTPEQRLLFERLSVFAAGDDSDDASTAGKGTDLEAIQAICASPPGQHAEHEPLPVDLIESVLERLVDHSMVAIHITSGGTHYFLHEELRLFASKRLSARSAREPARLAQRHLDYYQRRVGDAAARWFGADERKLVDWARAAWGDIVAAIETSIGAPDQAGKGLLICLGLITLRTPFVRGSIREIRALTERCLQAGRRVTAQPTDGQIAAEAAIAWLAVRQGKSADATRLFEECIKASALDDIDWRNNPTTVEELPPILDLAWGTRLFMDDRDPRAIVVLERARRKYFENRDDGAAIWAGMFGGLAAGLLGPPEQAYEISCATVEAALAAGATWATSWAELALAVALIKCGDPDEGASVLRGALSYQLSVGDQWAAAWSIELRCWALAAMIEARTTRQSPERVAAEIAHLAGGVEKLRAVLGIDIGRMGTFADESDRASSAAREVLGDAAFAFEKKQAEMYLRPDKSDVHLLALGQRSFNDVIKSVTELEDGHRNGSWGTLSNAEKDVALLIARGYAMADIAAQRAATMKTVQNQVWQIVKKLDLKSRDYIGSYIRENVTNRERA